MVFRIGDIGAAESRDVWNLALLDDLATDTRWLLSSADDSRNYTESEN